MTGQATQDALTFPGHRPAVAGQVERSVSPLPRTVDDLQHELLAVCKGGSYAETWRKLNAPTELASLRGEFSKLHRANELREEIKALNPNAALYYGWAGHGDERPHAA